MLRRDINTAIAPHLMSYTARPFYFIRCVSAKRGLLVSDLTRVQYIYFQKALHICIPPPSVISRLLAGTCGIFLDQRDIQAALQPGCHGNTHHMT